MTYVLANTRAPEIRPALETPYLLARMIEIDALQPSICVPQEGTDIPIELSIACVAPGRKLGKACRVIVLCLSPTPDRGR